VVYKGWPPNGSRYYLLETDSAIIDDVNGFISLVPSYINPLNEMICILEALDIVRWRDENPDKAKALKDKLPWLENYSEMDNPVVVIAKCK